MAGPLSGLKIIEFAGIGPGPFCGMLLSDMGAEVIRIDRAGAFGGGPKDVLARGRKSIALNLKTPEGVETALNLIEQADALIEGFRPGVMERLGLGPDVCLARNERIVFGRMTGWGQTGPLSQAAGHDINYISITGALHGIGRPGEKPAVPLNLVGDFGGGAMYLAFGLACGIIEARSSGKGQVVDAAMTDGSASLMAMFFGFKASGMYSDDRGTNLLDSGAHFYDTYECSDGKWISIGSIEPQFYALLREKAGLEGVEWDNQMDPSQWPALKEKITAVFLEKSRDEWCALMEGTDVCFAPILTLDEAQHHPHNVARETIVEIDGVAHPNVAPRFSRTKPEIQGPAVKPGSHTEQVLTEFGMGDQIEALKAAGAI